MFSVQIHWSPKKTLNGGFTAKRKIKFRNALFYSARKKKRKNLSPHPLYKMVKIRAYKTKILPDLYAAQESICTRKV
jgi:hypothetical protein